jgi:chorismate synthase
MLRWLTAGESHGQQLTAILEGLPAGVEVQTADVDAALARRRLGHGRGARMSFEQDEVTLTGGVRHGRTQGGPIAVQVGNTEWPKWTTVMSADPVDPEILAGQARNAPLTRPRPGHADLAGMQKYGFDDARPVLERASARETAARVALGAIAAAFLRQTVGAEVVSHVVAIGPVLVPDGVLPGPQDNPRIDDDPVRCADPATSELMVAEIDDVRKNGDTLGGVIEVVVHGLPPGLGSHVHWDRRLDARLAAALMGVQSVKAVEVGDGLETARRRGSVAHDEIELVEGRVQRLTDRAGGIEGGMTNGAVLRVRAAMKPISTLMRPLRTVDMTSGDPAEAVRERSDVCAVPAAGVVGEQMVAFVLAAELQRKFGGDTVEELATSVDRYRSGLAGREAALTSSPDEPAIEGSWTS